MRTLEIEINETTVSLVLGDNEYGEGGVVTAPLSFGNIRLGELVRWTGKPNRYVFRYIDQHGDLIHLDFEDVHDLTRLVRDRLLKRT